MANLLDTVKPLIGRGTRLTGSTIASATKQAESLIKLLPGRNASRPQEVPKSLNDPTIKDKVEQAVYAVPGVTRSKVKVTVADGRVTLHGEVKPAAKIKAAEAAAATVPEVRGVESQLHLPKTPAPSTPAGGQRKQTRKQPAARTKAAAKGHTERVNRDRTTDKGEPTPAKLAAKGEGRKAAPLGSTADTGGTGTREGAPSTPAKPPAAAPRPAESPTPAADAPKSDPGAPGTGTRS